MRNVIVTLFAAALVIASVRRAPAADIATFTAHVTRLGAHCSALVYYVAAPAAMASG
jgi:hypothetical protein